jgi:hypothetical protein
VTERRIWKFSLPLNTGRGVSAVDVPKGSTFLNIGVEGVGIVVWFCCPVNATKTETVSFAIRWTGDPEPHAGNDRLFFKGTHRTEDKLIWHVWLIKEPRA